MLRALRLSLSLSLSLSLAVMIVIIFAATVTPVNILHYRPSRLYLGLGFFLPFFTRSPRAPRSTSKQNEIKCQLQIMGTFLPFGRLTCAPPVSLARGAIKHG